jgi:hypothetical protein
MRSAILLSMGPQGSEMSAGDACRASRRVRPRNNSPIAPVSPVTAGNKLFQTDSQRS